MWSASVPGPRHDQPAEQNRSQMDDTPARAPHLDCEALEMGLWTGT